MRKRLLIFLILLPILILSRTYTLFYLNGDLLPVSVTVNYDKDDVLNFLFDKLSEPASGTTSFVPKNLLRAYFFVEKSLIIDLRSNTLIGIDFQQERYLIHQLLRTIFENFKAIDSVYIAIDGKRTDKLVNYVDVRYGFSRQIWSNWPVEGGL